MRHNPQWGMVPTGLTAIAVLFEALIVLMVAEGLIDPNIGLVFILAMAAAGFMIVPGALFEVKFYNKLAFQMANDPHQVRGLVYDHNLDRFDLFCIDTWFKPKHTREFERRVRAAQQSKRLREATSDRLGRSGISAPHITQRR